MVQKSLGTTVSFVKDSASITLGRVKSVSELKMDSEMIDVTTLDAQNGFRTYAQGARDAGELTLEGYLDSEQTGQTALRTLYLSGASVPFTITFPDAQQASFTALVKSVWFGAAQVDGVVGFGATLRLSGGVTFT